MELLDFCYDILMRILEEINPDDLASCARTCRALHGFIEDNTRLFKSHYLTHWDDLRQRPTDPEPDWIAAVKRLVKCQKIVESKRVELKLKDFKFVASTLESLVDSASNTDGESRNEAQLKRIFDNNANRDAFLNRSSLYTSAGTEAQKPAKTEEEQQLSAKLRCLHGMPLGPAGRRSLAPHPYARSRVYDLRNYTAGTGFGPFHDDGSMSVDWEMLESIMVILAYNSDACCPRFLPRFKPSWSEPFGGLWKSTSVIPRQLDTPLELRDPYNVSGIWRRVVCFLDYTDLFNFNFGGVQPPSDQPREPVFMEEAIRHIAMKLKVTEIKPPGRFDNPDLPVVLFEGVSKLAENGWDPDASSGIRGQVCLTPHGEVRWTTISIFSGNQERWRSEGIQVGGLNSKRGVIGTWFDKDYDDHGPVGPTAFWKVSDGSTDEDFQDDDSEDEAF